MERFHRLITALENALSVLASLMLLFIMLLVVLDVGLRSFLHAPLGWSYDLISMYLMAGLFFFSISSTLEHEEHVRVDVLLKHFPPAVRTRAARGRAAAERPLACPARRGEMARR